MNRIPRMLTIDDCPTDNRYVKLLIELEGVKVDCTYKTNAILALDYLKEISADQFPDVILVDINMPLMNGFEFIEHYEKSFLFQHPNTKVYIMSSSCRLSEIETAKKNESVEDFFEKPLSIEFLQERILANLESVS